MGGQIAKYFKGQPPSLIVVGKQQKFCVHGWCTLFNDITDVHGK